MKEIFKTTERGSVFYFLLTIFLFLFPFLVISIYNHPSADDFSYSHFGNRFDFWAAQVEHYNTWTGRYTATALLTVNPIDYTNLTFYKVLPVLLFLSFAIAVYIFLKNSLIGSRPNDIRLLSFLILFLYVYYAPEITEAFYWMAGSVTYQLASILTLLLFSIVIYLPRVKDKRKKMLLTLAGAFLCAAIVGLNETSMLVLCVVFVFWFLVNLYLTKSINWPIAVLLGVTIIAALLVTIAPGNLVRMAEKPNRLQFLYSVIGSIKTTLLYIASWIPMTVLIITLFSPLLNRVAGNFKNRYSFQGLSLLKISLLACLFFGFIALCFFPSYWSQGGRPPARTVNVIYILFILGAMTLSVLFFIYLQTTKRTVPRIPIIGNIFLVLIITVILTFKPNNVRSVYKDLYTGTAYRYHLEMNERYSRLENCDPHCFVPPIQNKPSTIFAYDLAGNPSEPTQYYNRDLAYYFGLKKVKTKKQ